MIGDYGSGGNRVERAATSIGGTGPDSFQWSEGRVDPDGEYLSLWHDDWPDGALAVVGPPSGGVFPVEFPFARLDDAAEATRAVRKELDYFLVELGEPDPWAYAYYHCSAFANAYPPVHWSAHHRESESDSLAALVHSAWNMLVEAKRDERSRLVVRSVPVLFFGDLAAYEASPIRVVTVGLNPSLAEFPTGGPWSRFPAGAQSLVRLDRAYSTLKSVVSPGTISDTTDSISEPGSLRSDPKAMSPIAML